LDPILERKNTTIHGRFWITPDITLLDLESMNEGDICNRYSVDGCSIRAKIIYKEEIVLGLHEYQELERFLVDLSKAVPILYEMQEYRESFVESLIRFYMIEEMIIPALEQLIELEISAGSNN
jgi:hypothetical protein